MHLGTYLGLNFFRRIYCKCMIFYNRRMNARESWRIHHAPRMTWLKRPAGRRTSGPGNRYVCKINLTIWNRKWLLTVLVVFNMLHIAREQWRSRAVGCLAGARVNVNSWMWQARRVCEINQIICYLLGENDDLKLDIQKNFGCPPHCRKLFKSLVAYSHRRVDTLFITLLHVLFQSATERGRASLIERTLTKMKERTDGEAGKSAHAAALINLALDEMGQKLVVGFPSTYAANRGRVSMK